MPTKSTIAEVETIWVYETAYGINVWAPMDEDNDEILY
jgi:hypothetical protein